MCREVNKSNKVFTTIHKYLQLTYAQLRLVIINTILRDVATKEDISRVMGG
jgi:hypothetical protein